jgi:uncharacterized membrane protein YgcG
MGGAAQFLCATTTLTTITTVPPCRAAFGLSLFAKSSNQSRIDLLAKGLPGLLSMLLTLAPTLGDYYGLSRSERRPGTLGAGRDGEGGSGGSNGGGGGGSGGGGGGSGTAGAVPRQAQSPQQQQPAAAAAAN